MRIDVLDVSCGARAVPLRLPFRFGAVTLLACPQLFVRATVDVAGHGRAEGYAAELAVPRWFDKRASHSPADNVRELCESLQLAAQAYRDAAPDSSFVLAMRLMPDLQREGERRGWTELTSTYGAALLDRAVLDGLCTALGASVFEALRANAIGAALLPEFKNWDWNGWLARREPLRHVDARHTVGLLDALDDGPLADDGLPSNLTAAIARYGHRFFKVKLGGNPHADLARLRAVLDVLDAHAPGHRYTLDGNEQYADIDGLLALFDGLAALPSLPLYIEQPLPREASLQFALPLSPVPLLMDEADGTLDAFARGRACGWTGVSSKLCKGLYKALVNRARCDLWNREEGAPGHYFMSAEDLTCPAGLGVQQDLAWLSLLALSHSERNGHHYIDGMSAAPAGERFAFAAAHPDLYESSAGHPRLRIRDGRIAIGSLFAPGFAHRTAPDFDSLHALSEAPSMAHADATV